MDKIKVSVDLENRELNIEDCYINLDDNLIGVEIDKLYGYSETSLKLVYPLIADKPEEIDLIKIINYLKESNLYCNSSKGSLFVRINTYDRDKNCDKLSMAILSGRMEVTLK